MSPFDVLLVAHLFGDFIFQTNWMAVNKTDKLNSLIFHAFIYTLTIYLYAFLFTVNLSLWAAPLIFFSHCLLDRRIFPLWWVKNVMRVQGQESKWLVIVVDQTFHIFILSISLYI